MNESEIEAGPATERRGGERRAGERRSTERRFLGRREDASGLRGAAGRVRSAFARMLERGLRRIAETPLTHGNSARLLVDGPAAYPAMLECIANAERRVHFENYIIRDDEVGRRFSDALRERARAGVEVRVLHDWFGSFGTARSYWNELEDAGCEVRSFGPPLGRHPMIPFTRDHRKLLVVDGWLAVTGGLCIGAEWEAGGEGDAAVECWRDTAVLLEGPVAAELDRSFGRMWIRAGGSAIAPLERRPHRTVGDTLARVVDGRPRDARAYRFYQLMASLASRSLYITMAYPLVPTTLRRSLAAAAREGVDVRMLVPSSSDVPVVSHAARAHYGSLLRAGVRLYEWTGPMLHAKTAVADGSVALVGSTNLNPFSLLGNYELDVEIQDPTFAAALESQFLADLERAREVRLAEWRGRGSGRKLRERFSAGLLWLPTRVYSG